MTQERKPAFQPNTTYQAVTLDRLGSKSFENQHGHFWIYEVNLNGTEMVWFVYPSIRTALVQANVQVGDEVRIAQEARINEKTNKTYKTQVFVHKDLMYDTSLYDEAPPTEGAVNNGGAPQPQANTPASSNNGQTQQPAANSVEPDFVGLYVHCLKQVAEVYEHPAVKKILEHYQIPGVGVQDLTDLATHFSIRYEHLRIHTPPETKDATTAPETTQEATPETTPTAAQATPAPAPAAAQAAPAVPAPAAPVPAPATPVPAAPANGNGTPPAVGDQDDLPF
jgi:hypothetical protein